MSRSEFFDSVASNLKNLAAARIDFVPRHRLFGVWKLATASRLFAGVVRSSPEVRPINQGDENLRAYDLVATRIPGVRPLRLRVIAYYVDGEPSQKAYVEAKRKILTWHNRYTDEGRAPNEKFAVGAVVIGSGSPWAHGFHPDGDGLPDGVDYQLLAAPSHHEERRRYDVTRWVGNRMEGLPIFRALEPERFEFRWKRVEEVIDAVTDDYISLSDLAKKTETPEEDLANMFVNFQASGRLVVRNGLPRRCDLGRLSISRLMAQTKGPWYAQRSRYAPVTWGLGGVLSILVGVSKQFLPDYLARHSWLFILFGFAAVIGVLIFGMKSLLSANDE